MAVITISRQVAALGDEISALLAEKLGYKFIGRKVIEQKLIENKEKISLPVDAIVGREYDENFVDHINIDSINVDDIIYDIGMKTINKYKEIIDQSNTIFVNGTAGKYEDSKYATGTRELLNIIANSKAVKVAGGGDGVSAVKTFKFDEKFTFLSTGGGATLDFLKGEPLPGIECLTDK